MTIASAPRSLHVDSTPDGLQQALLFQGVGCHYLSDVEGSRGLMWDGISSLQGGPAMVLVEARHTAGAALIMSAAAKRIVPHLTVGDFSAAQVQARQLLIEHREQETELTILTVHAGRGIILTTGRHRVVSLHGKRARVIGGTRTGLQLLRTAWAPGHLLVALAQTTEACIPIGGVGRALLHGDNFLTRCQALVKQAADYEPDYPHGIIGITYPTS